MCHALRLRYGLAARFLLNYDFVFMSMLLSDPEVTPEIEYRRCIVSPIKKRACSRFDVAMDVATDYGVILAYWKFMDAIADEGLIKSLTAKILAFLFRGAYRKACGRAPEFDALVRGKLEELGRLESEKCGSMDMIADKFAMILQGAAEDIEPEPRRRALQQLLYHTGRVVYLLDAVDDLKRDVEAGVYNPLIYRFGAVDGVLSQADMETVSLTIAHSQTQMASAFELLDTGVWTEIVSNIIYAGIPWVSEKVFAGEWEKRSRVGKSIED